MIASTLLRRGFTGGGFGVHSLSNISTLCGKVVIYEHFISMKNIIIIHIADATNGVTNDRFVIQLRTCCDFATYTHDVAFNKGLTRHATALVLCETGIKNRIADGVTHFIRMPFAD